LNQALDLIQALWGGGLTASGDGLVGTAFWIAVPQIVVVNILLSGDNAVVIALACRALPARQRLWGLLIGAGTAAALLIIFSAIVVPLLTLPYLKLIGGLALLYIAVQLLLPQRADEKSVEAATRLWRVVRIVAVADLIMSLDNVIAVAAVARGNVALLVIGLGISVPIVLAGAALITALLDRFPILVWVGAGLLGWIAGDVIASDTAVSGYLIFNFGAGVAQNVEIAVASAGALLVIAGGVIVRRR